MKWMYVSRTLYFRLIMYYIQKILANKLITNVSIAIKIPWRTNWCPNQGLDHFENYNSGQQVIKISKAN